ncbi:uncharacterized protein [Acropora muricata]|uniref:uncharacterized protein n=1 Tax=Acropora muricata TaxID=159855 RepID=UPI0034E53F0A
MGKSLYYEHVPCGKSSLEAVQTKDVPRVGNRFYCNHCGETVSKSTFYEHKAIYGSACGIPSHDEQKEVEANLDSDSDNENLDLSWGDEDMQFFSEGSCSMSDRSEDDMTVEDSSCEGIHKSSSQPEQRTLAMFKVADRAIVLLLKFLKLFLAAIAKMMQSEVLLNFANIIPQTLYFIEKNLCLHKDNFIKYAVCPKCKTLYKFDDCIQWRPNGEEVSKKCRHVNYPHHPHKTRRKPCGTVLMKTMRSKSGRTFLYPKQVYCFKKVTSSLEDLINKPNFMDNCEKWRNRFNELPDNILGDCFEGRIWREFQYVDGEPFLAVPNNFG